MITGSEEESRELMMNAAIRIVARCGFEGFTTKKWAKEAGVAEGSLYYHFKSKDDLLTQAFFMIDREVACLFQTDEFDLTNRDGIIFCIEEIWRRFFRFLLEHEEWALYFQRFRTSPRYTKEIQEEQYRYFRDFSDVIRRLRKVMKTRELIDPIVLWSFVSDTTTAMAFRVLSGGIEANSEIENQMTMIIMRGLLGVMQ